MHAGSHQRPVVSQAVWCSLWILYRQTPSASSSSFRLCSRWIQYRQIPYAASFYACSRYSTGRYPTLLRSVCTHVGYRTDKYLPLLRSVYAHVGYSTDRYPPLQSSFRLYSDWYSLTQTYINTLFIVLSVPSADGGVLASTKFAVSYTWSTRMGLPVPPHSTAINWRRKR